MFIEKESKLLDFSLESERDSKDSWIQKSKTVMTITC